MSDLAERPDDGDPFNAGWNACYREAADEIERLEARCEAYKGQVWAGSNEIARLRAALLQLVNGLDCEWGQRVTDVNFPLARAALEPKP